MFFELIWKPQSIKPNLKFELGITQRLFVYPNCLWMIYEYRMSYAARTTPLALGKRLGGVKADNDWIHSSRSNVESV
jgi:hypothetical protein